VRETGTAPSVGLPVATVVGAGASGTTGCSGDGVVGQDPAGTAQQQVGTPARGSLAKVVSHD